MPPQWGRKVHEGGDSLREQAILTNTTISMDSQRNQYSSGGELIANRQEIERSKPLCHNIYSLPIAENDPKGSTWTLQSYPLPSDSLISSEFQPSGTKYGRIACQIMMYMRLC